ncbi:YjcZ family sporulation protein [Fictibacillus phosphorivorans]|uniref:YjcZ family sporulation protein n=1 Tax=Fictibacillus phosphorivorans TaxID=1221500 RepID=UPI00203D8A11|nr:YjcZ family sporulation protein [Fictibacillus phosphorivorans]MCM3718693.1 YjcZ family sporulation protein [Fictibacillus phosphorivorans]MCM3776316.1 YjcZ family sporulation protein [Fictibacillus phosphorivorans]
MSSRKCCSDSFTLYVVLFVLLIIVGAVSFSGNCCVYPYPCPYPYAAAANVPVTGYWNV